MKNPALFLVTLALTVALAGCGKSDSPPVKTGNTSKLCEATKDSTLVMKCFVSDRDSTVGITIDTHDDEAARQMCIDFASKMKPLASGLSGQWKLQIFSPYRDDKPLSYCALY